MAESAELRRWSSMSCDEVLAELRTRDIYELVADSKRYQVEVVLLEDLDSCSSAHSELPCIRGLTTHHHH